MTLKQSRRMALRPSEQFQCPGRGDLPAQPEQGFANESAQFDVLQVFVDEWVIVHLEFSAKKKNSGACSRNRSSIQGWMLESTQLEKGDG